MNSWLARLLVRVYPPAWRERYGEEFEALLAAGPGGVRTVLDVVWAALCERVSPTKGDAMNGRLRLQRFDSWSVRAPWAIYGLAPVMLLGLAYFIALFVLWSGWRIFLAGQNSPFVPVYGLPEYYFGIGRMLYETAPLLIGWMVGIVEALRTRQTLWPAAGLALVAWMGGTAHVHASRLDSAGTGHVSMSFSLVPSASVAVILLVTLVPWILLRMKRARTISD